MNACFFDLDGTLIDSRADLAATVNHARRDLSLPELPDEVILSNVGRGARYLMEKTVIVDKPGLSPEEAVAGFMSRYMEHATDKTVLYPGVRTTLAELADRGWALGVCTSKPAPATRAVLQHLGLDRFFRDAVVAGGDCPEMKPSPAPLRMCAERLRGHRLSSHDWMVGDNWTDMGSAAAAGIKSAFCTFGFGILGESRYTVKINRMDELLRFLKAED